MINQQNNTDPVSLKNKVVVVAGGSNKPGRTIAEKLAQTGASIVIADVHLINAEIVVQHLMEKYQSAAAAVGLHISEIRSVATTLKGEEGIDIWVNAGLLNKDIRHIDEHLPELKKVLTIQNNSHGSNFCISCFTNSFCVSPDGRADGPEFWQKVLALVLDIVSAAIR